MTREDIVRKLGGNRTRCDDQDIIPRKKREKYPANNILENDNENERLSRTMKIS